jgi:putative Holliday junction resolvase
MSEFVRLLGIDFGQARIGVAVSDDLGMLAHPLETVSGHDEAAAVERIVEIARDRGIQKIVIGLPLRMDGTEGSAVEKVRAFAGNLRKVLPEPVSLIEADERLTTVMAMEKLHAAGRNEKNSRDRIDQAAAVEILQGYLDAMAPPVLLERPEDDIDE